MSRKSRGKSSRRTVEAARELRQSSTRAEETLWYSIRNSQLNGIKFRRQHPYDRFVLDFFCVEHQLAIEVEGAIHNHPRQAEYDRERAAFLEQNGIRIIRITNNQVEEDLEAVLLLILEAIESPA